MSVRFTVPLDDGSTKTVEGTPVVLTIGARRVRFALQPTGDDTSHLVHIASGRIAVKSTQLASLRIAAMLSGRRMSLRDAAAVAVAELVDGLGADELLRRLDAAPVLNGQPRRARSDGG